MTSIFKRAAYPYYYMKVKHPNGKWKMKSSGTVVVVACRLCLPPASVGGLFLSLDKHIIPKVSQSSWYKSSKGELNYELDYNTG